MAPRKKTGKTTPVVSIGNVKCDGEYHGPGKEWDCPEEHVGVLLEVGAVERIRVAKEKKTPPSGKNTGKGTENPEENDGSDQDNPGAGSDGDSGDQE